MLKRIITALVMLCVFIPVVIFSDTAIFPVAIAFCACVATFEMLKCMGIHKKLIIAVPLYAASIAFPLLMRFMNDPGHVAAIAFIAAIAYVVILFAAYKYIPKTQVQAKYAAVSAGVCGSIFALMQYFSYYII